MKDRAHEICPIVWFLLMLSDTIRALRAEASMPSIPLE